MTMSSMEKMLQHNREMCLHQTKWMQSMTRNTVQAIANFPQPDDLVDFFHSDEVDEIQKYPHILESLPEPSL